MRKLRYDNLLLLNQEATFFYRSSTWLSFFLEEITDVLKPVRRPVMLDRFFIYRGIDEKREYPKSVFAPSNNNVIAGWSVTPDLTAPALGKCFRRYRGI